VFLSSHELDEVQRIADRVAIIRHGRLIVTDTVARLRQQAPRTIELRFNVPVAAAAFAPLDGVQAVSADGERITLRVAGELASLLRAIADYDPVDLVARHADSTSCSWATTARTGSPMPTEIARLDLYNRRRSTIAYAVGMALYVLVIVALYPAFRHSTGSTSSQPTTRGSRRCSASAGRSPLQPAG